MKTKNLMTVAMMFLLIATLVFQPTQSETIEEEIRVELYEDLTSQPIGSEVHFQEGNGSISFNESGMLESHIFQHYSYLDYDYQGSLPILETEIAWSNSSESRFGGLIGLYWDSNSSMQCKATWQPHLERHTVNCNFVVYGTEYELYTTISQLRSSYFAWRLDFSTSGHFDIDVKYDRTGTGITDWVTLFTEYELQPETGFSQVPSRYAEKGGKFYIGSAIPQNQYDRNDGEFFETWASGTTNPLKWQTLYSYLSFTELAVVSTEIPDVITLNNYENLETQPPNTVLFNHNDFSTYDFNSSGMFIDGSYPHYASLGYNFTGENLIVETEMNYLVHPDALGSGEHPYGMGVAWDLESYIELSMTYQADPQRWVISLKIATPLIFDYYRNSAVPIGRPYHMQQAFMTPYIYTNTSTVKARMDFTGSGMFSLDFQYVPINETEYTDWVEWTNQDYIRDGIRYYVNLDSSYYIPPEWSTDNGLFALGHIDGYAEYPDIDHSDGVFNRIGSGGLNVILHNYKYYSLSTDFEVPTETTTITDTETTTTTESFTETETETEVVTNSTTETVTETNTNISIITETDNYTTTEIQISNSTITLPPVTETTTTTESKTNNGATPDRPRASLPLKVPLIPVMAIMQLIIRKRNRAK